MARLDSYFYEPLKRLENTTDEEERKNIRKLIKERYYDEGNESDPHRFKYKGEIQNYAIDKPRFLRDLKVIGASFHELSYMISYGEKTIRTVGGKGRLSLNDGQRELIEDITGLNIMEYTYHVESSVRQPYRDINVEPIKQAMEKQGLKSWRIEEMMEIGKSRLSTGLKDGKMALHLAMELCDILKIEHEEVLI